MQINHFLNVYSNNSIVAEQKKPFNTNPFGISKLEAYKTTTDKAKEHALRRLMSPILVNLSRTSDGKITGDRIQRNREDVLALTEDDLNNVDINWDRLQMDLTNRTPSYATLDRLVKDMDHIASQYAYSQFRIKQSFTGSEREEYLKKLDSIINNHVDSYAKQFSRMTGSFLSEHGVNEEAEMISASIKDLFQQRKEQYTTFIQKNEDFAGIKGTPNEWLVADNTYMAQQLQSSYREKLSNNTSTKESGYNMDELMAIGTLVKEMQYVDYRSRPLGGNKHKSEEEFGVELGFQAMKYALIKDSYEMRDGLQSKLDMVFQEFVDKQNEKAADYIKRMRNDPFVRNEEAYRMDWNDQLVQDIMASLVGNLDAVDVNGSFQKDMSAILQGYINHTKNTETSKLSRYHEYHNSWNKSNYIADWNRFVEHILPRDSMRTYLLEENPSYVDITI
ncbi:hypothetical protein [Virgibacillus dokdonensis]|uniref:LXG domain-containing protein n=1 Tax=Virgibacillus dokdonensis TaxID=302167 RepID=A0ABU7VE74_9BACI